MKTIDGAFAFACSKRSRTRLAPTPTNISTKSDPEMLKKGTPASPATARASSVLPVPGGPYKSTPLGILAPIAWNFCGASRYSLISCNSSTASSRPATSANVIFGWSFETSRAFDFPKDMTRLPPPCICCMRKKKNPRMIRIGKNWNRIDSNGDPCCWSAVTLMPSSRAKFAYVSSVPYGSVTS
jgi:hypothetical protein